MADGSTSPRSPSRSPPPAATAEELHQLNSTLRSRLARSAADLQAAATSRDAAVDHQHQFSLTLLRQTRELRTLEHFASKPTRSGTWNFGWIAISDRDTLQDQRDHLAEEVRLAGAEIEQLQEDHNDLDRARGNAEHELQLSEASLARVQASLVQAESRIAPPAIPPANAVAPDVDRLTRERDEARTAATDAEGQVARLRSELKAYQDMRRDAQTELNRLRSTHAAATADLIQTVKDRDAARADASRYRSDASDLQQQLASAAPSQADQAKQLDAANRRLDDLEHSVRVLRRERDAARQARDQALRTHETLQQALVAARQKLAVVASAVGIQPATDMGTSGPAAVLHSLRATPADPPGQQSGSSLPGGASVDLGGVGSQGDAPLSSSKRPRGSPTSPKSSPAPPAKRRVAPLSPDAGGSS
ncbi:hypothetical protein PR001_g21836 [Phytophthora rubi]|uniref:Uncharacterized protein n=1 Tax=Phytophthora rubi TaxID=129364 RepID=A0A6A3J1I0_9STRA|nr:hypothetical protein PR001_g21836 [Phytophthora rubi]